MSTVTNVVLNNYYIVLFSHSMKNNILHKLGIVTCSHIIHSTRLTKAVHVGLLHIVSFFPTFQTDVVLQPCLCPPIMSNMLLQEFCGQTWSVLIPGIE